VVAGVALVAGLVLTLLIHADPDHPVVQGIDDAWYRLMVDHQWPAVVKGAEALSLIGSAIVTWPVRIIAIIALAGSRRWLQLSAFVAAVVTSELLTGPLKAWVGRPRPPGSLIETSGASYPSGHAIAAAVTAFALVVILMPAGRDRLRAIGLAATFAALMALSRTYLSAHWLTDVVGGTLLGVGLALGWPALFELVRARIRARATTAKAATPTAAASATDRVPRTPD
jgi:membrane-associated phospholipid phosphatase